MRTRIVMALLLLAAPASMTTVLAQDPVDTAVAVAGCAVSIVGPDGQKERVRNIHVNVDVIDQNPECLA